MKHWTPSLSQYHSPCYTIWRPLLIRSSLHLIVSCSCLKSYDGDGLSYNVLNISIWILDKFFLTMVGNQALFKNCHQNYIWKLFLERNQAYCLKLTMKVTVPLNKLNFLLKPLSSIVCILHLIFHLCIIQREGRSSPFAMFICGGYVLYNYMKHTICTPLYACLQWC